MATTIKKSKINQSELRKFMKEKKSVTSSKANKIDSPLAKYNNLNQLSCVLCNSQIKSELLWATHVRGRTHKENISKLKDTQIKNANAQNVSSKRMYEEDSKPFTSFKKPKINEAKIEKNNLPGNFFDKKPQSSSMIGTNSSSDEDEEVENEEKNIEKPSPVSGLPSNFFDENAPKSIITDEENAEPQTQHVTNKVEDLPEGFFDDPIVDAKVRHVEYKDAMDEEWEKFQKVISTESTVSQAIMDEDIEESKAEREIDEIDEQMHNWSRVQNLQMKKDKIANSAPPDKMDESELSLSADEQEYEEFLDWRSKKVR